jgi:hypothetical protein
LDFPRSVPSAQSRPRSCKYNPVGFRSGNLSHLTVRIEFYMFESPQDRILPAAKARFAADELDITTATIDSASAAACGAWNGDVSTAVADRARRRCLLQPNS